MQHEHKKAPSNVRRWAHIVANNFQSLSVKYSTSRCLQATARAPSHLSHTSTIRGIPLQTQRRSSNKYAANMINHEQEDYYIQLHPQCYLVM